MIFCGSHKIPWTTFADAARGLQKHLTAPCCISHNDTKNPYMKDVNVFLHAVLTIERSRKPLHSARGQKLREINEEYWKSEVLACLHYYRDRKASYAKDKIYGLHSLVDKQGRDLIDLDLTTAEDAHTHLCMEHIKKAKSLEILKYVLWSNEKSKLEATLPSWVPDWTVDIPEPRWQKQRLDRYALYKAGGGETSQIEFGTVDGRWVLRGKAVKCGVVANVGEERVAQWNDASNEVKASEEDQRPARKTNETKKRWSFKIGKKPSTHQKNIQTSSPTGQSIPRNWLTIAHESDPLFLSDPKQKTRFFHTLLMDTISSNPHSTQKTPTALRRTLPSDYAQYETILKHVMNGTGWPNDTDGIYMVLETATLLRKFFVIKEGHFGIGPARMQSEDEIFVIQGGCCPLVLRPSGNSGRYRLIGDCFLEGFMDGEALMRFDAGAAEAVCIE